MHLSITHLSSNLHANLLSPSPQTKKIDDDPLSWLCFEEDCILTSCSAGHVRTWDRPREGVVEDGGDGVDGVLNHLQGQGRDGLARGDEKL